MTDKKYLDIDPDDPLLKKLNHEVDEAHWPLLENHYERGALVFVDPQLDIIEVAVYVIRDNVEHIKKWSDEGLIYNPKEKNMEVDQTLRYRFLITQPYVLVQPILKEQ